MQLEEVMAKNRQTGRGYAAEGKERSLTAQEFLDISIELGATQLNPDYRALHEAFAAWMVRRLNIRTSLELGSGPGYLLYCLNRLGVDARGLDGNPHSRDFFTKHHPEYADRYRIDPLFEQAYAPVDAFLSIEVFEHIEDAGLHAIMTKVRDQVRPRFIVFSSTPHADPNPGWDLQWGHINLKQPAQWHAFFARFGYEPVPGIRPPVTEWATLYRKKPSHPQVSYRFSLSPARPG